MERRDVGDRALLRVAREAEGEEQLIGPVLCEVAPQSSELAGPVDRMLHGPERDRMVERVEPELEGRDDAVVRARSADAPEQVGVLVLGRVHEPAVGGDELDREQVVERQPELPHQPSHPAAQRQAGDPGVRDDPDRADQAEALSSVVEVAEEGAALHARCPSGRVDLGASHP